MAEGNEMLMNAVESYIKARRAAGYRFEDPGRLLKNFARFAAKSGDTHVVAKTAISWAELSPSQPRRDKRLKTVVRFARFIRVEDDQHQVPPHDIFIQAYIRRIPYIFSDGEIQMLVNQALQLRPLTSLRPHTYSTLFGLMAVTGLRVSEALKLKIHDLTGDGLLIRDTKFRKNRLVPLHETTIETLHRYLPRRQYIGQTDDHFFLSNRGKKLSYESVRETFHKICHRGGIPRQPGNPNIRLHDLRHTFAVRSLENSPDCRHRVSAHMLALMTYMGHATLASTYWYLETTPQLMTDIARKCETFVYGEAL